MLRQTETYKDLSAKTHTASLFIIAKSENMPCDQQKEKDYKNCGQECHKEILLCHVSKYIQWCGKQYDRILGIIYFIKLSLCS